MVLHLTFCSLIMIAAATAPTCVVCKTSTLKPLICESCKNDIKKSDVVFGRRKKTYCSSCASECVYVNSNVWSFAYFTQTGEFNVKFCTTSELWNRDLAIPINDTFIIYHNSGADSQCEYDNCWELSNLAFAAREKFYKSLDFKTLTYDVFRQALSSLSSRSFIFMSRFGFDQTIREAMAYLSLSTQVKNARVYIPSVRSITPDNYTSNLLHTSKREQKIHSALSTLNLPNELSRLVLLYESKLSVLAREALISKHKTKEILVNAEKEFNEIVYNAQQQLSAATKNHRVSVSNCRKLTQVLKAESSTIGLKLANEKWQTSPNFFEYVGLGKYSSVIDNYKSDSDNESENDDDGDDINTL